MRRFCSPLSLRAQAEHTPRERAPLSVVETEPESVYPSHVGMPMTQRYQGALELDEAPRTVRGELLTPGDDDD